MINFFKAEEEQLIISAIRRAEANTTGEIRVHLEKSPKASAIKEAKRIFRKLGMHKTEARNAVLIILLPEKKSFAIIGDQAIDAIVPDDFWAKERDLMQSYFRKGQFCAGLVAAIDEIGDKLKTFFPVADKNDNELPDQISYGEPTQE